MNTTSLLERGDRVQYQYSPNWKRLGHVIELQGGKARVLCPHHAAMLNGRLAAQSDLLV